MHDPYELPLNPRSMFLTLPDLMAARLEKKDGHYSFNVPGLAQGGSISVTVILAACQRDISGSSSGHISLPLSKLGLAE